MEGKIPGSGTLSALLRTALWQEKTAVGTLSATEWQEVYDLAGRQGVLALVRDGLERSGAGGQLPREMKIRWSYNVGQIEEHYGKQKQLLIRLAAFFNAHGIPVMLLKGHGLSRCYPVPEHRPCGDIDIWLFGRRQEGDELIRREWKIPVDEDKHHHTTFVADGILVENHYNFLNIHAHASNRQIDAILLRLAESAGEETEIGGEKLYLPSADFNALFLLRHAGAHFAADKIGLRHVADWALFIDRYHDKIDWEELDRVAREMNMHRFLYCLNAVSVDYLGLDASKLPAFERNEAQEQQVLDEILSPRINGKVPGGNILKIARFKFRRWWANRWKHRIVYREKLLPAFIYATWGHCVKPRPSER